ncbi:hypothetical protein [Hyunsoonleella aestuarii]|uniref:DUF1735 domain-containing protein n=1 Tax=Hyunsoonleella aestuarii TaxID=912802 RepID=A0ABP8E7Q9_9FLAO|nr:hypothetical protein [Hyunsoonleella aestuarii]
MKHIYKIFLFLAVIVSFNSCDNSEGDNEGKFDAFPETGWVEFNSSSELSFSLLDFDLSEAVIVPLEIDVQVPVNPTDLIINYSLVSVSGADPNSIFSNSGKVIAEAGKSSFQGNYYPVLELDLKEAASITEILIFDVVLNSTSRAEVTAGVSGGNRLTSVRIEICPLFTEFKGTFSVTENFIEGSPFAGSPLGSFFGESYQVEIASLTDTRFLITASSGFDSFLWPDTVMTLGDCETGPVSFDDAIDPVSPVIAFFRLMTVESASLDYVNKTITCTGVLGEFGPYQFVLTKL